MNESGKLLTTLTAGFAAGVVIGILFAPEVGETTRENIKTKASELGEELGKHYEEEIQKLKAKIEVLSAELKQKVSESGLEEKVEEMKTKVADAANGLKEKVDKAHV